MGKAAHEILRQTADPNVDWDALGVMQEARRTFHQAMGEWVSADAHGFWMEPESGDGHCDPAAFVVAIARRIGALGDLFNAGSIASPIEAMLGGALLWLELDWAGFPGVDYLNGPVDQREQFGEPDELVYFITPQATIGNYRADFLIWFALGKHHAGLVVECDGHDYHDKTKEQAARDKRRDRELLTAGYPVVRFTGSEIYKDPLGCVAQLRAPLLELRDRVARMGWADA